MDFSVSDEQLKFHRRIREIAQARVAPAAAVGEKQRACPSDLLAALAGEGLFDADYFSYILALEEISGAWASLGAIISVHRTLVCYPLERFGTTAQKSQLLPQLLSGAQIGCYAFAEASAGSDAGAIVTTAVADGDTFVLDGKKMFVTNARHAHVAIVYASTDPARGRDGLSAFIVPTSTAGFAIGPADDKLGLHAAETVAVDLTACRVPKENLLGELHKGFDIARAVVESARIDIAAQSVGIAQACLNAGVAHAKERRQFGKPIAEFEAIQWMLADMSTEIEAARLLTHRAAATRSVLYSSMAKLYASEAANRAAYNAIQIFGGHGYLADCQVERYFRDARAMTLFEETSEIERLVIERELARQ